MKNRKEKTTITVSVLFSRLKKYRPKGQKYGVRETGKQCKAVPTLQKQADSVYTEPACFMLVGALPQSPQNTKTVFWNDG